MGLGAAVLYAITPTLNFWARLALLVFFLGIFADLVLRRERRGWMHFCLVAVAYVATILWSWDSMSEQFQYEHYHTSFPIVLAEWNTVDKTWVLRLAPYGKHKLGLVKADVGDVDRMLSYADPGSIRSAPSGFVGDVNASTNWLHHMEDSDLRDNISGYGTLLTIAPRYDDTARFNVRLSTSDAYFEEYIVLRRLPSGSWGRVIRLVDLTNHLNLVNCQDAEVSRPINWHNLSGSVPCESGTPVNISAWEDWQRETTIKDGGSVF